MTIRVRKGSLMPRRVGRFSEPHVVHLFCHTCGKPVMISRSMYEECAALGWKVVVEKVICSKCKILRDATIKKEE